MNWLDIVIIALVGIPAFLGWRNGVIRLIFTLAGGILGIILAGQLWGSVAPMIPLGNSGAQRLVAFAAIFFLVMVAAWVAARLVRTALSILLLAWIDRLGGLVIGATAGIFVATAFVAAAAAVPVETIGKTVLDSALSEPLSENLGFVRALLPSEFDRIEDLVLRGEGILQRGL